ncbi:hypothetical protein N7533_011610 [Penicillium manginii]|uniref:uncharacterized protein n=1 Tax=Penicillium manginii TaxID=203109 RepID=UPI00254999C7|nr:uncharacterized protein N7533_011610 [Penicillium manginii]KAJ5742201.1 hypothetical protein N7533_011610 [Penicillium manginii]
MIDRPDILAAQLDLTTDKTLRQINQWSPMSLQTIARCVHEVFEERAVQTPSAPAVSAWDLSLTYAELNQWANRLAHYLQTLGVGPEVLVPLCFDKSAFNVVSMLAVLKAGGAFVPLDPTHPAERHRAIITDTNARVVLTSPLYSTHFSVLVLGVVMVDLQNLSQLPSSEVSASTVSPSSAAVVIYTSGSTGKAKGVVLEHRNLCTSMEAHGSALKIGPSSRVLQFAAHIFDISLQDILTTITRGGCVCIPSLQQRDNDLPGAITKYQVNWACITPTVAGHLLEPKLVPTLKTLTLAGEAVSQRVVDIWSPAGETKLESFHNCYGPAECTVYCSWNGRVGQESKPFNIGHSLASRHWVVNADNHNILQPIGSVGELVVEGPLVARGYLNDAAKTEASFITNPAWAAAGNETNRRMYRTGDLVRYTSDGSLDYLGRKDFQVKLHGQRIELGEVEHALLRNERVQDGVVLFPRSGSEQQRLVAIVSIHSSAGSGSKTATGTTRVLQPVHADQKRAACRQVTEVKEGLMSRLPNYMVPSVWIAVQDIPINASGKIDRAQITKWIESLQGAKRSEWVIDTEEEHLPAQSGAALQTSKQCQLRNIVSQTLNLSPERVRFSRSFLGLGGDSITAMQLVAVARGQGLAVKVKDVLRSRSLTALLDRVLEASPTAEAGQISESIDLPFPLAPMQRLFMDMSQEPETHFNQSFFLQLQCRISESEMLHAVNEIAHRHSMLRVRFNYKNDTWEQRILAPTREAYRFTTHHGVTSEEIATILCTSQKSLDLVQGPVFAVDFIDNGNERLLYLVAHHLAIDLVSWRVILGELELLLGGKSLPSHRPFPFQTWVRRQIERAEQLEVAKELGFSIPAADFAYWGMDNRPNTYGDTIREGFTLDPSVTQSILQDSNRAWNTEPDDIFLAAFLSSMAQTFPSRLESLPAIFVENHGRKAWDDTIDLAQTVGWFTTKSPVSARHSDLQSPAESVYKVKDLRRRVSHGGLMYFMSRFLTSGGQEAFGHHWPMEILFNNLGQYQQLERTDTLLKPHAPVAGVSDVSPRATRLALIEVSVVVVQGAARFDFVLNKHMKHLDLFARFVQNYEKCLTSLASELPTMQPQRSLSDFPLLPSLTYRGLDRLNQALGDLQPLVEDIYPCSPMQDGLLLSQSQSPGNYQISFTYALHAPEGAPVHVDRLQKAWQQVVSRHAIMRTIFVDSVSDESAYLQVVLKNMDAFALPENRGFAQPDHSLVISNSGAAQTIVELRVNHALIDAVSVGLLLHELQAAYDEAFLSTEAPGYQNYIRFLQAKDRNAADEYWARYVSGVEPCILPPMPDASSQEKQLRSLEIPLDEITQSLRHFCELHETTVANFFHAVWALVLRTFAASNNVCFGYLAAGREAAVPGIESIAGPFINLLVGRFDMDEANTVLDVVKRAQLDYAAGLEHQHYPLASLHHYLKLEGAPLFNTIISVQRSASQATDIASHQPSLTFESVKSHDPTEVRAAPIENI